MLFGSTVNHNCINRYWPFTIWIPLWTKKTTHLRFWNFFLLIALFEDKKLVLIRRILIDMDRTLLVCLQEHVNIYFWLLCTIFSTFNSDLYRFTQNCWGLLTRVQCHIWGFWLDSVLSDQQTHWKDTGLSQGCTSCWVKHGDPTISDLFCCTGCIYSYIKPHMSLSSTRYILLWG